jgi:integrase
MPGQLITDAELDITCQSMASTTPQYNPVVQDYMRDLYATGARPAELTDQTLWTYINNNSSILDTLKGNNDRDIESFLLSNSLLFAIQNNIRPYNSLSIRQLEFVMKRIITPSIIGTNNKSAISYIFRYNKAKLLHNGGSTDLQIQTYFGWNDIAMAATYYNQDIFFLISELPGEVYYIVDSNFDLLIDSNNDAIVSQ